MKDFRVYVVNAGDDPLAQYSFIGWRGKDEDDKQYGSIFRVPIENSKEFFVQLSEQLKLLSHPKPYAGLINEGQKLEEIE